LAPQRHPQEGLQPSDHSKRRARVRATPTVVTIYALLEVPPMLRITLALVLLAAPVHAEVVRVQVSSRADVLAGKAFGAAGGYEKLTGKIYFTIDPRNPVNQIIADVDKAPKNAAGKVEFSSDFY
jgi:hypothetical protein